MQRAGALAAAAQASVGLVYSEFPTGLTGNVPRSGSLEKKNAGHQKKIAGRLKTSGGLNLKNIFFLYNEQQPLQRQNNQRVIAPSQTGRIKPAHQPRW